MGPGSCGRSHSCSEAVAAFAGGTVHGLRAWLDPFAAAWLWQCALLGSALAGALLLAGAALHALRGGVLRVALVGPGREGARVELVLISRAGLSRDAVWAGAAHVVLLLGAHAARGRGRIRRRSAGSCSAWRSPAPGSPCRPPA